MYARQDFKLGGSAAHVVADPTLPASKQACGKISYFTAYKSPRHGLMTNHGVNKFWKLVYSRVTMVDNRLGVGMFVGSDSMTKAVIMEMRDSKVFGETKAPDCPADGGYCNKFDKCGFAGFVAHQKG